MHLSRNIHMSKISTFPKVGHVFPKFTSFSKFFRIFSLSSLSFISVPRFDLRYFPECSGCFRHFSFLFPLSILQTIKIPAVFCKIHRTFDVNKLCFIIFSKFFFRISFQIWPNVELLLVHDAFGEYRILHQFGMTNFDNF